MRKRFYLRLAGAAYGQCIHMPNSRFQEIELNLRHRGGNNGTFSTIHQEAIPKTVKPKALLDIGFYRRNLAAGCTRGFTRDSLQCFAAEAALTRCRFLFRLGSWGLAQIIQTISC